MENWAKILFQYLGWGAALVGWCNAIMQWRKKRKAEAELKEIRRRGEAPFFSPSDAMVDRLFVGASRNTAQTAHEGTVLSALRHEVEKDIPAGTPIRFVVENDGLAVRNVALTLDDEPIALCKEPDLNFAHGFAFLEYLYQPTKHGTEQRLSICFETSTGMQDCHVYLLKHGFRFLKRIEPK